MTKELVLEIRKSYSKKGFDVIASISGEGFSGRISNQLPPYKNDPYDKWKSAFESVVKFNPRGKKLPKSVIEDINQEHNKHQQQKKELMEICQQSATEFMSSFQKWLSGENGNFGKFREDLAKSIGNDEEIRVFIQTSIPFLKKLPWHEWNLFDGNEIEIALCSPDFEYKEHKVVHSTNNTARILVILGNSDGINLDQDKELLEDLKKRGAIVEFLPKSESTLEHTEISDQLWEQNWDIFVFAGHSEKGRFWINRNQSLKIDDLKYGLKKAIKHGLQLAIFNSCDGLELADALMNLNIPQVIVMRELVPDLVAQLFLKFFLKAFSNGTSLYLAMREARLRLHEWAKDKRNIQLPAGSAWLPVIYQNPATIPLEWKWEKEFIASPEVDYENGKVYYNNKEFAQALDCFLKAAEQGHTDAQNYLGIIYSEKYNNYHEAIKWFTRAAAEKGNVKAQINLGDGYFNGTLGEKNQKKAAYWYSQVAEQSHQVILEIFHIDEIYDRGKEYYNTKNFYQAFYWFRIAASQGNADGQNGLGTMYSQGKGVKLNHQKAMEYFHKAAEQGHAKAKANLGVMFERTENYQDAFKWFYEAALQGYAFGQVKLGNMYRYGKGTAQDNGKAVYWYREAAKQGDADAQCNLGMMYQYGKGVDRSLIQSVEWYHKAANQGHADAQNYLGFMYHNGKGVEKSEKHAVYWYHKATDQGHAYAQYNLGTVYEYGKEEQNAIEANKWYCKAFEQANEEGLFRLLGIMYENGKGTKQDRNKARDYYFKATEQGDISAQYSLGRLFLKDGDTEVAFNYFSIAAKQGFDQAQYDLGKMCYDGKGTNKDESEAFVWFEKAAEQGHIQAQNQLGIMYWNGIGVHKNDQESFKWFKKAAKQGDIQAQKNLKAMQG
jgi:TPR repeat protein